MVMIMAISGIFCFVWMVVFAICLFWSIECFDDWMVSNRTALSATVVGAILGILGVLGSITILDEANKEMQSRETMLTNETQHVAPKGESYDRCKFCCCANNRP